MCLCITKQETVHKGQARYRRHITHRRWQKEVREKEHKNVTRLRWIYVTSYIQLSETFLYIYLSFSTEGQIIFSRTKKDFIDAKKQHYRAHNAPQKIFHLLFICSQSEKHSKRMKASPTTKGAAAVLGNMLVSSSVIGVSRNRGLTAESKDGASAELLLLFSVCYILLHAIYSHLSCVIEYTPSSFKICFKFHTSKFI